MVPTDTLSRLGRVSCVINPQSGSTPADAADLIRAKLSGLPDEAKLHVAGEGDLPMLVEDALADDPDTLIVWGRRDNRLRPVACRHDRSGHPALAGWNYEHAADPRTGRRL